MNRKELENSFYEAFGNMDYFGAAKILGHMEAHNFIDGKYRYLEMLLFFEQKEYDKVRSYLRNQKLTWEEKELYLVALAELGQFDELEQNIGRLPQISYYGHAYIRHILRRHNRPLSLPNISLHKKTSYFEQLNKWTNIYGLAEVCAINKEKLLLLSSNGDPAHISSLQQAQYNILEQIEIDDPYFSEIVECVNSNSPIDHNKVLYFPVCYIGNRKADGTPDFINLFDGLWDVVKYLDFAYKMETVDLGLEALPFLKKLENAAKQNNAAVIEILSKFYVRSHFDTNHLIDDGGTPFADMFMQIVRRYAPGSLRYIENHKVDAEIESILSPKGLMAYKAAVWQYDACVNSQYGTLDAGMLCLSYMRILELELNEKIISPLSRYKSQIIATCDGEKEQEIQLAFQNGLSSAAVEKIKSAYMRDWGWLEKLDKGIELGPLYFFLLRFKNGKNKYPVTVRYIESIFCSQILTEDGLSSLKAGVISEWINSTIRETYRNPPAHTRYVGIATALECRDYVIEKLRRLSKFVH